MRCRPTSPVPSLLSLAVTLALVAVACGSSDDATPPVTQTGNEVASDTTGQPAETAETAEIAATGEPSDAEGTAESGTGDDLFPDILGAVATQSNGLWQFDVTVSSPYDSADRYADGFRVLAPDGEELGFRLLTHDHANEQPFTRSLTGVAIPAGVSSVVVEGRDQVNGFGGDTVEVVLD